MAAGKRLVAQTPGTLPVLHGPFRDIGVQFKPGEGKLLDARIDVVANGRASPVPIDGSRSEEQSDEMSKGTEAGLAARAVLTGYASGVFSLSLGSLDSALHLTTPPGVPATNSAEGPSGTDAKVVAVPSPPIAVSYTAYLVEHLGLAACNNGSPADGLSVEPLATLAR